MGQGVWGEGKPLCALAKGVSPPPRKTNLKKILTSNPCSDKQAGVLHGRTSLDGREGQDDLSCAPKAPLRRPRDLTCAGVAKCRDIVEPFQPVDGSRPLCERPGAVRCRGANPDLVTLRSLMPLHSAAAAWKRRERHGSDAAFPRPFSASCFQDFIDALLSSAPIFSLPSKPPS